jgi:hypothetical protein
MRHWLRRLWPVLKAALGLAILILVGRRFAEDLRRPELWERPLHPGWLVAAGVFYLAGIGLSAVYWRRLLAGLGERPGALAVARAYYVGHLGKYLPGKAWAVMLRAGLIRATGVSTGFAALTTFYEVLTTMASGALFAAVLFALLAPSGTGEFDAAALAELCRLQVPEARLGRAILVPLALLMVAVTGLPLLPGVVNPVVRRLSAAPEGQAPRLRTTWLVEGLALTAVGWVLLGASLGATVQGLLGDDLAWTPGAVGRVAAGLALACVAGFVILVAPGGLGVREFFLTLLLAPELEATAALAPDAARAAAVLAVLVLRLVWTAAELAAAAVLYPLRNL